MVKTRKLPLLFVLVLFFFAETAVLRSEGEETPVEPKEYASPEWGKLSSEYTRSLQITKRQKKAIAEDKSTWFANRFKVGFGLRPKADSLQNFDFDRSSPDVRNTVANQTQFYLVGDIHPNLLFKITFQDIRLWGGETIPGGAAEQRFANVSNAGNLLDTRKNPEVANNQYSGFREAFLDLRTENKSLRLRTGRQILEFGDGRILGARNDSLNGNSFDAIRLTWKGNFFTTDAFGSVLSTENNSNSLVSPNSQRLGGPGNVTYGGIHQNFKWENILSVDLYQFTLWQEDQQAKNPNPLSPTKTQRSENQLNTTGFRLTNRTLNNGLPTETGWDWMVEAAWQTGYTGERVAKDWLNVDGNLKTNPDTGETNFLSEAVRYKANIVGAQLGYSPTKEWRIGVQYIQASGDPNRNDGSVGTYNPLFATRRMAGGSIPFSGNGNTGAIFWQNVKDYSLHIKYESNKWGTFIFNPHWYYKMKLQDGYYDNNNYVQGSNVTGETASTEDFFNSEANNPFRPSLGKRIATEINLIYIITPFDQVSFWFGASTLYGGDAIRNQKNNPWENDPLQRYNFKENASFFTVQSVFAI